MSEPFTPTAFVAWAHRGHRWSPEQEQAWAQQVSTFTALLRLNGIDADVDLYHLHEQGMDWNRYGFRAIADHELVFVPVSASWIDRFDGSEDPSAGAGAAREADALLDLYNYNRDEFRRKVALVYLPGTDTRRSPVTLGGLQRFTVTELTTEGLDDVLRYAHRVPRWERPALGAAPSLQPSTQSATDAAAADLRTLSGSLQGSTTVGDAAVRGIETALAAAPSPGRDLRSPASTPSRPPGPTEGWIPVTDPVVRLTTLFDELGRNSVYGPVLEVQLLTVDETARISGPELRALTSSLVDVLTPPPAVVDPLMGRGSVENARPAVDLTSDRVAVTCGEPRAVSPFGGASSVTPSQLAEVTVFRSGSASASVYLSHDTFGAVVNTASLTREIDQLVHVASAQLPAGVDRVVPVVRIGPLARVSPGDPAEMGGNSRTLPWTSGVAVTAGADSIDRASVAEPATVQELAAQLGDAMRQRR